MTGARGMVGLFALITLGAGNAVCAADAVPTASASVEAGAAPSGPSSNVRYKAGKTLDFEQLLIQGRLKRPEITVVTGNASQGGDGLLMLRENFLDRMAQDVGEDVR